MKKDAKYTFMINREEREKFKSYCKIMNVSPSDILGEVVVNFNSDVDKIMKMQNIEELQSMVQGKFVQIREEMNALEANKRQ